jgi:GTP cyclohydrolase II
VDVHGTIADKPGAQRFLSRLLAQGGRADVQRAIAEILAGRPVVLTEPGRAAVLAFPVDGLTAPMLAELRGLAPRGLELVVSGTRAAALGCQGVASGAIPLPASVHHARLMTLAGEAGVAECATLVRGDRIGEAAIELTKLAHLLPAVLTAAVTDLTDGAFSSRVLSVAASDALAFHAGNAASLRLVSSAHVPLRGASECEVMVFRDDLGEAWTLLRVGRPDLSATVPVRVHSACLTGDAFASLRCDCGDQLKMAVASIETLGGGILLYLNQEGCGIGLANKMRAYRLQDQGLDTIDANTTLGFEEDERSYEVAARMLAMVGIRRIALLTNNPSKVDGLRKAGIEVAERMPLMAPVRRGNRRYLETKRHRAGHIFGEAALLPLHEDGGHG